MKKYHYEKDYKSGDIIDFGKYTGQTFDKVCQFDPSYIQWMRDNKICNEETLNRMHRAEFKYKKLKDGHAIVFN